MTQRHLYVGSLVCSSTLFFFPLCRSFSLVLLSSDLLSFLCSFLCFHVVSVGVKYCSCVHLLMRIRLCRCDDDGVLQCVGCSFPLIKLRANKF